MLLVVDGANLLRNSKEESLAMMRMLEKELKDRGYRLYIIFDASVKYDFEGEERKEFMELLENQNYEMVEPRTDADIRIIEKMKMEPNRKILSNDMFEEYKDEHPILEGGNKIVRYDFDEWKNGNLVFGWNNKTTKKYGTLNERIKKCIGR